MVDVLFLVLLRKPADILMAPKKVSFWDMVQRSASIMEITCLDPTYLGLIDAYTMLHSWRQDNSCCLFLMYEMNDTRIKQGNEQEAVLFRQDMGGFL